MAPSARPRRRHGGRPAEYRQRQCPQGDAAGTGSLVISGGQVHAFGGITVGDVYSQGGSTGLLSLQGGLLDLASRHRRRPSAA